MFPCTIYITRQSIRVYARFTGAGVRIQSAFWIADETIKLGDAVCSWLNSEANNPFGSVKFGYVIITHEKHTFWRGWVSDDNYLPIVVQVLDSSEKAKICFNEFIVIVLDLINAFLQSI